MNDSNGGGRTVACEPQLVMNVDMGYFSIRPMIVSAELSRSNLRVFAAELPRPHRRPGDGSVRKTKYDSAAHSATISVNFI